MTAEIAILNKSAVALATDSAVTISSGNSHEKVFDSADKLFELSCEQPIRIMIYNGMQFAGIPLSDLIKEFRTKRTPYDTIVEAANCFLDFLENTGRSAPESEKQEQIRSLINPMLSEVRDRIMNETLKAFQAVQEDGAETDLQDIATKSIAKVLDTVERRLNIRGRAKFHRARRVPRLTEIETDEIRKCVAEAFHDFSSRQIDRLVEISGQFVLSDGLSSGRTGIVIAGMGRKERFPTLVSYELDGVVAGKLKLNQTASCDIERGGEKAYVRPFAQKEMVERFLYGLDAEIQQKILNYCDETISSISESVLSKLKFPNDDATKKLSDSARRAEKVFLDNLKEKAFKLIETNSRQEIEDMIQFMPKVELAKMAEALVELTSMKRKVTVRVETVGGPVDVAVISKSDGFVWIKRKHYFPPELNMRYFERLRASTRPLGRNSDEKK